MRYWGVSEVVACLKPPGRRVVTDFEQEVASYLGVPRVTATRYGRTALYLALKAVDVRGHEVLLPALTCSVVRDAVCLAGAMPVFVDIDPADLSMDLEQLRHKTSGKTRALIITHYYGNAAGNLEALLTFAKERNLTAIEDCAHCLGLSYKGRKVGTFGDMAAFSLGKNTLNFGGGIVVCRDEIYHERVRRLVDGQAERIPWTECGMMYPIVNGGFIPLMERAFFNRVGRRASKRLIGGAIKTGNMILNCLPYRKRTAITVTGSRGDGLPEVDRRQVGQIGDDNVEVRLTMPGVVAALGRTQLRKLESLNRKRIAICETLTADLGCYYLQNTEAGDEDSIYSFFPMRFEGADIQRIREHCEGRGLPLLPTWPAAQQYWPEQDTDNVRRIRDSLLMWFVNPMTTRNEVEEMKKILGPFAPVNPAGPHRDLPEAGPLPANPDIGKQP